MIAPFPILLAPNFPELAGRWSAVPEKYADNALAMLQLAQRARDAGGIPVRVSSWYRSPIGNALANGGRTSQHLTASAMDIVPSGDVRAWFDRVRAELPPSSFGQFIFERDHVHLSLPNRASGRTGEVLLEPTEGHYVPVPGSVPPDDSREGYANPNTLALLLALAVALFLLFGDAHG